QLKHCRRIRATRVDSCYARDRRTAALAEPRGAADLAGHGPPVPAAPAPARPRSERARAERARLRDLGRAVRGAGPAAADDRARRRYQPVTEPSVPPDLPDGEPRPG